MIRRLALFLGVLLLALFAAEGALSFFAGRSLREAFAGRGSVHMHIAKIVPDAPAPRAPAGPAAHSGDDSSGDGATHRADDTVGNDAAHTGSDAAGGGEGADAKTPPGVPAGAIYALHDDPRVGYVLKPDSDLHIMDGAIHTDHLGLRVQPGPPPPDDALRIVVLGDSVAFGLGVDDDEALAARLAVRLAELRGPDARPVACRTVAVPSWNQRSAEAFLEDHWDELRPDLVLYVPCANDVYDIDSAFPSGERRVAPDPSSSDPWLMVSVRYLSTFLANKFMRPHGGLTREEQGLDAVASDVCAESRRRHDENAEGIARMYRLLEARGCRMAIVWYGLSDFTWFLASRLQRLAPEIPEIPLLRWSRSEFLLPGDPHSNAATLDVWARWLAQDLVDRGWIDRGAGNALPAAPPAYEELHLAALPPADQFQSLAEAERKRQSELLVPEIDFRSGRGILQIFGGVNPDLTARSRLLFILRADGPALELELEPVAARPDLYPLTVFVEAAGKPIGSVVVPADQAVFARLELPADLDRSQPLEVRLTPERWIVLGPPGPARLESMLITSFRPLRFACPAKSR